MKLDPVNTVSVDKCLARKCVIVSKMLSANRYLKGFGMPLVENRRSLQEMAALDRW